MKRALALGLVAAGVTWIAGCTTPLALGERFYREGDRLSALETWRDIPIDDGDRARADARISVVESEFRRLVIRYKKRAAYFESKQRLAEAILDYRLALKLQPDDTDALGHVQQLARRLALRKAALYEGYVSAFHRRALPRAREQLVALRRLDPFDSVLETAERKLRAALQIEVKRRMAEGRRGFTVGDHASARRAFRRVLSLDPDNESAQGYLSYIATMERERRDSLNQPRPVESPVPFATDAEIRAEGFHQNGLLAEHSGDLYAAIRNDLRALAADSNHARAASHLNEMRAHLADRVEGLIESGRLFFRQEDLHSALDQWQRAQLIDPANERARAYIARAERQIENLERLRSEPEVSTGAK